MATWIMTGNTDDSIKPQFIRITEKDREIYNTCRFPSCIGCSRIRQGLCERIAGTKQKEIEGWKKSI